MPECRVTWGQGRVCLSAWSRYTGFLVYTGVATWFLVYTGVATWFLVYTGVATWFLVYTGVATWFLVYTSVATGLRCIAGFKHSLKRIIERRVGACAS